MTYLELQDAVLLDRFAEGKRDAAKQALNYRYGRLWAAEPWTFKLQKVSIPVAAGAQSASLGTSGKILNAWDDTTPPGYQQTEAVRPEDFYNNASRVYGSYPNNWTVIGNTIYFDRIVSSDHTLTVVSEIAFVPLTADNQEPLLPDEFHPMLAAGASSYMLKQENDDSWQGFEQEWQESLNDLRKGYLTSALTYTDSYPAWP